MLFFTNGEDEVTKRVESPNQQYVFMPPENSGKWSVMITAYNNCLNGEPLEVFYR